MYPDTERGQSILLVEDDPITRRTLALQLGQLGLVLFEAAAAPEAIRCLREHPVDLMITDLGLPGMDGFDLIRAALRIRPSLKVIVVSASHQLESATKALHLGAIDYLVKPVRIEQMEYALRQAINTPLSPSLECNSVSPLKALNDVWNRLGIGGLGEQAISYRLFTQMQCIPFALISETHLLEANQSFEALFKLSPGCGIRKQPLEQVFNAEDLEVLNHLIQRGPKTGEVVSQVVPFFSRYGLSRWLKLDLTRLTNRLGDTCLAMTAHNQSLLIRREQSNARLSRRTIQIREEERHFLAQELHDMVAQDLAALHLNLSTALAPDSVATDWLEKLRGLSWSALENLRDILRQTWDRGNQQVDLTTELNRYCQRYHGLFACHIDPSLTDWLSLVPQSAHLDCLRVLQEAIRNTAKHARAENLWIKGGKDQHWVVLETSDDGVGLTSAGNPPKGLRQGGRGFGMVIMKERLQHCGGKMEEVPNGKGTTWRIFLPALSPPSIAS